MGWESSVRFTTPKPKKRADIWPFYRLRAQYLLLITKPGKLAP